MITILQALCLNGLIKRGWNSEELAGLVEAGSRARDSESDVEFPRDHIADKETAAVAGEELDIVYELLGRMGIDEARREAMRGFFEGV